MICGAVQFYPVVLALYIPLHSSEMNVFKLERIDGDQYSLVSLFSFFICFICFRLTSAVMMEVLECELA